MDGNISGLSSSDDSDVSDDVIEDDDRSIYDTDDEVDAEPVPANFQPIPGQHVSAGQPLKFVINTTKNVQASVLPLCLLLNCRSACNKEDNLRELLHTIGPSVTILSETWERNTKRMDDILRSKHYGSVSYYRQNKAPGGGCAIVFDKSKYRAVDPEIMVPENVEAVWTVLIPKMNV